VGINLLKRIPFSSFLKLVMAVTDDHCLIYAFNDAMSMTNRYFTSLFVTRS